MKKKTQDLYGNWDGSYYETDDLPDVDLVHELDDEDVLRQIRAHVVERGGRIDPGAHEDRHTTFKVEQDGVVQKRRADLVSCGHEAVFSILPKGGGRMVTACVVCDSVAEWPRMDGVA